MGECPTCGQPLSKKARMLTCYLCADTVESGPNKMIAHKSGWTWFTGYAAETVHICLRCRTHRRAEVSALKAATERKPEGFPRVRAPLPTPPAGGPGHPIDGGK